MATSKSMITSLCCAGVAAITLGCTSGGGSNRYAWWTNNTPSKPTEATLRQPVRTNIRVADMEAKNNFNADARKHYKAALKHDPKAVGAIVGIAKLDEKMGRNSQAERGFRKALDYDPKSVEATLGLARLDQLAGRHVRAEQGFQKAINLQPSNAEAHEALGMYYAGLKRWDEAIAKLTKASALNSKSAQYRYNLAKAMAQSGDLQGAMPHFAITVGEAAGHYNIGYILQEQGKLDAAELHYRRALVIDPNLQEAAQMLSELQRNSGNRNAYADARRSNDRRMNDRGIQQTGIRAMSHQSTEPRNARRSQLAEFNSERREPISSPHPVSGNNQYNTRRQPIETSGSGDNKTSNWPPSSASRQQQTRYDELPISSPVALRRTVAEEREDNRNPTVGVNPFDKSASDSDVDVNAMTPEQREQWANQK